MERPKRRATWFATLRRDGRLFAALALALFAIQALQPLVAARASEATGTLVICTSIGADPAADGGIVWHEGCSHCIAGACGMSAPAQAATDWSAAFDPAFSHRRPLWSRLDAGERPLPLVEGPPGIRAPPFNV